MKRVARWSLTLAFLAGLTGPASADAPELSDAQILAPNSGVALERVETRITAYSQRGYGFQSQAGPLTGKGSETLHVLQLQGAFVLRQGEHITHRVWVPVDVITSASTNASDRYYGKPDAISTASAQNIASETAYRLTVTDHDGQSVSAGASFHSEENFRSWLVAFEYALPLADDNAELGVGLNQVLDWFDVYQLGGKRVGRTSRASSNLNLSLSQLLSPSTVVALSYGFTLQRGELSNTWNSVPEAGGARLREQLPRERARHAWSARLNQFLPWNGALKLSYRLYADDWAVRAHTFEVELGQRLLPWLALGLDYRYHRQSGVEFFTTLAPGPGGYLTADSDLGALHAQTLGLNATLELATGGRAMFLNFGYDRYFRSDDLVVDIATWASGLRF